MSLFVMLQSPFLVPRTGEGLLFLFKDGEQGCIFDPRDLETMSTEVSP